MDEILQEYESTLHAITNQVREGRIATDHYETGLAVCYGLLVADFVVSAGRRPTDEERAMILMTHEQIVNKCANAANVITTVERLFEKAKKGEQ